MRSTYWKLMGRLILAAIAGGIIGLMFLSLLVMPHEWSPMGRWGTLKVFSLFLVGGHFACWLIIFVPTAIWMERNKFRPTKVQALLAGGALYCAIVALVQMCMDHLSWDTLWLGMLAFPTGATTSGFYYAHTERSGEEVHMDNREF